MMRRLLDSVLAAFVFRYLCHTVMIILALWNEIRPAPTLPDTILALVPKIAWVERYNYWIWFWGYIPLAALLWWEDRRAFIHFMYISGVLGLLRGLCIPLTVLGPVSGVDLNANIGSAALVTAFWKIINPVSALSGNAPLVYMTKDLFFSGHTSSSFLLLLYCWRFKRLRAIGLAAHIVVVASVFLAHLHYTIDVVGAYAITIALHLMVQKRWPIGETST
jgi:hypothetical protein